MSPRVPENCSCSALRQAARHLSRFYDEALAPLDLSLNQYAILSKIARHGRQTVQGLADRLVMDRSTVGHLLRPLQSRSWLTIETSEINRRQRLVGLTPSGEAHLAEAKLRWEDAERAFERAFGPDEAASLRSLMNQVVTTELRPTSS